MLLVLSVVALASVLGFAMLSIASLQRQMEHNLRLGPEADGLAESGVNLAIYYLLHPETAPGYPGWADVDWHWPGTGGPIGFGADLAGTINVLVTRDPAHPFEYEITSTGAAASSAVSRTITARVFVNADYEIAHAAVFGNDVAFGAGATVGSSTELTSAYARGAMTLKSTTRLWGYGYRGISGAATPGPTGGFRSLPIVPVVVPPDLSKVRSYLTYQLPNDPTVYHAEQHPGGLSLTANWGPSATNPAGVHYVDGGLTLLASSAVQGTLIVKGTLAVNMFSTTLTVTSLAPTLPALVVGGNIDFTLSLTGGTLAVQGVCWVGGKVDGGALTPATTNFNVTGALLCDGGLFPTSLNARSNIRIRPELIKVRDFTDTGRTPKSVRVMSWRDGR